MTRAQREAQKVIEAAEWDLADASLPPVVLQLQPEIIVELMGYELYESFDSRSRRLSFNKRIVGKVGRFLIESA